MDRIGREQQSLRAALSNINPTSGMADPSGKFVFDETAGRFIDKATGQPVKFVSPIVQKQIAKIAELEALKATYKQEMSGTRSTLESQFPSLYTFGDEWSVTPNPQTGGVAPAGAPRTGPPPEWKVPPVGSVPKPNSLSGVGEFQEQSTAKPRRLGEVIDTGRGRMRVIEILPSSGGLTRYKVEGIQ